MKSSGCQLGTLGQLKIFKMASKMASKTRIFFFIIVFFLFELSVKMSFMQ